MTTSLQRTYRNLRIGIAGTVVLIGVSVAATATSVGVLPSISAYYYSPARNAIVGALIAAALAILALSGRGLQRALLDAAGLFAPLIALVPTPIRAGTVPGYEHACQPTRACVPVEVVADLEIGVTTYLIVGGGAVVLGLVATVVTGRRSLARNGPSLLVAAGVLLVVFFTFVFARDAFIAAAHLVAGVAFFALIAAVAVVNAVVNAVDKSNSARPSVWRGAAYSVIAVAMIVAIAVLVIGVGTNIGADAALSPLLIGECAALLLFLAFWILQSLEKWDDPDPSIR